MRGRRPPNLAVAHDLAICLEPISVEHWEGPSTPPRNPGDHLRSTSSPRANHNIALWSKARLPSPGSRAVDPRCFGQSASSGTFGSSFMGPREQWGNAGAASRCCRRNRCRHRRLGARAWGAVGPRMEPPPPGAANTAAALHTGEPGARRVEGPVRDPMYPSRPRAGGCGLAHGLLVFDSPPPPPRLVDLPVPLSPPFGPLPRGLTSLPVL